MLFTIIVPRLLTLAIDDASLAADGVAMKLLRLANSQPIVWPSIALFGGTVVAIMLFPPIRQNLLQILGSGTQNAIAPLINTAAVIGFGGVVTHTAGFARFTGLILEFDLPPLLSMFFSVSMVSAVTGSASGGLQIFMQTMAPAYLEMGIQPEIWRLESKSLATEFGLRKQGAYPQ